MEEHLSLGLKFWCEGMLGGLGSWAAEQDKLLPQPERKSIRIHCPPSENTRNPAAKFLAGLEQRCLGLKEGYSHPPGWLDSGHLQTMYGILNASSQAKLFNQALQEHRCLEVRMSLEHYWDGAFHGSDSPAGVFQSQYAYRLHADVYPPILDDAAPTPTLILVGLDAGSSLGPGHRHYLEQQQRDLMRVAYEKKGWRTISIQQVTSLPPRHFSTPDCDTQQNKWNDTVKEGRSTYGRCKREDGGGPEACGISSRDLRVAIEWLAMRFTGSKMIGVGFFLGANSLAKYLGEVGCNTLLAGAISLANPFDLPKLRAHLHAQSDSPMAPYLYSSAIRLCHKADYLLRFASHQYQLWGQFRRVMSGKESVPSTLPEVPAVNSPDPIETLSSLPFLRHIKIPTLCLQSQDDPFLPTDSTPLPVLKQSPYIILVTSQTGGHLGWYQPTEKSIADTTTATDLTATPDPPRFNPIHLPCPKLPNETTPRQNTDQWSHQIILDFAALTFNKFNRPKG